MTSSQRFAVPFRFGLRGSLILAGLLSIVYGAAIVVTANLALPIVIKVIAVVMVLAWLIHQLRRHVLFKGRRAVSTMIWEGGDQWQLISPAGMSREARLLGNSFAHPWLVVLNFRVEGESRLRSVVMMIDSTDSTAFRRLLMRMRGMGATLPEGA